MSRTPFHNVDLVGAVLNYMDPVQQARVHLLVFPATTPQAMSDTLRAQARNWVDPRVRENALNSDARLVPTRGLRVSFDIQYNWERDGLIATAVRAAYFNFLPWLVQDDVLQRLRQCHRYDQRRLFVVASAQGHLQVVKWLCAQFPDAIFSSVVTYAAAAGRRHVVEWMWCRGAELTRSDCEYVTISGDLEFVQWFFAVATGRPEHDDTSVCHGAVASGNIALVEWLRAEGYQWDVEKVDFCAGNSGHLPMMQYVKAQGVPITWECVAQAMNFDDPEILAWLQALGFPGLYMGMRFARFL